MTEESKEICKVENEKKSPDKYAMILSRFFMTVLVASVSTCVVALAIFFIRFLFQI